MKVFVTNQPYMLYETVEVLRRYVNGDTPEAVTYTYLRAHETVLDHVCRILLEKKI